MNDYGLLIERIVKHFKGAVIPPPASPADLRELTRRIAGIPSGIIEYYQCANGLDVPIEPCPDGWIHPVGEVLKTYPIVGDAGNKDLDRLIPVRGDGCGDYDCVLALPGVGAGSVVFWDHEVYVSPAYLLGSCFYKYLEMLVDHWITCYTPEGDMLPDFAAPKLNESPWIGKAKRTHPWPFQPDKWMERWDPSASDLLRDKEFECWLREQNNLQ